MKRFGISNIRLHLEQGTIHFWAELNGKPVRNFTKAIDYLKNYEVDNNGNPKKKDDHVPDSLLCGMLYFARVSSSPVPSLAVVDDDTEVRGEMG